MHDFLQGLHFDSIIRQSRFIGNLPYLPAGAFIHQSSSVFSFEIFRSVKTTFEACGQILSHVISPNSQESRVRDNSLGAKHILGHSSAQINHQSALFLF